MGRAAWGAGRATRRMELPVESDLGVLEQRRARCRYRGSQVEWLGEFWEDGWSERARRTPYSEDRVCEWSGQGSPSPAHGLPMRPASAPEAVGLESLGRSRRAERTNDPRAPHRGGSLRLKTLGRAPRSPPAHACALRSSLSPPPRPAPPRGAPPPGPSTLIGWLRGRVRQAGQWEHGALRGTCAPAQAGLVRAGRAPRRGARGEGTRGRGGARGGAQAGRRADWPTPRCEAVNGGAAGPRLQNKGQAARGAAAAVGCLAPCRGANGRNASRAAPAPPESRARTDRGSGRMDAAGWGADRRAAVSTGGPGDCCAGGYFVATRGSCDCGQGPEAPVGRLGRRAGRERAAPVDVFDLI